jgi:hypothetical protein
MRDGHGGLRTAWPPREWRRASRLLVSISDERRGRRIPRRPTSCRHAKKRRACLARRYSDKDRRALRKSPAVADPEKLNELSDNYFIRDVFFE